MANGSFTLSTNAHMGFIDISAQLQEVARTSKVESGLLMAYCPHTTAGITINEGADPAVQKDLIGVFKRIIPGDYPFQHSEGNSPSHAMATLTGSSATVIIEDAKLLLGTWQRIFFCEYDGPRTRRVCWKIIAG